jgi:hypothetical protein
MICTYGSDPDTNLPYICATCYMFILLFYIEDGDNRIHWNSGNDPRLGLQSLSSPLLYAYYIQRFAYYSNLQMEAVVSYETKESPKSVTEP